MELLQIGMLTMMTRASGWVFIVWMVKFKSCKSPIVIQFSIKFGAIQAHFFAAYDLNDLID